MTRNGTILARATELVDTSSAAGPIFQILRIVRELALPMGVARAFAAGGVAVPGLVRRDGTVWAPNLPGWERVALGTRLQHSLGIPVAVESDRNAAALGEAWLGAARNTEDAVVLMVGTGVGAGIISGGRLVRGAHELSGCAGWMVVTDTYPNEVRRVGQLETLTAGPAVPRMTLELLSRGATCTLANSTREGLSAVAVAQAARAGDTLALSVFEQIGNILGRGVANLISLFDPEVVIISGGMVDSADLFLSAVVNTARQWAQPLAAEQTKIRVSRLRANANLLGVARLAWAKVQRKGVVARNTRANQRRRREATPQEFE